MDNSGAIVQIQRIAELLGYRVAWSQPTDDSIWFLERDAGMGYIRVVRLDDEIRRLTLHAGDLASAPLRPNA